MKHVYEVDVGEIYWIAADDMASALEIFAADMRLVSQVDDQHVNVRVLSKAEAGKMSVDVTDLVTLTPVSFLDEAQRLTEPTVFGCTAWV